MTTWTVFVWGFGTASVCAVILFAAWTRRTRRRALPSPLVYAKPLTDGQYDELAAEWAITVARHTDRAARVRP